MSKKRIITLFVSLSLIIIMCVLGGAVFVIRSIDVVFSNGVPADISTDELIKKSNIDYGKSIFSISESMVVSNIESNFPNIKVRGVERVFPNKVVLKLAERRPVIAIKFKDKPEYLVLDSNMCAIEKVRESNTDKLKNLCIVTGFELNGNTNIYLGKPLPTSYGIETVVIQHIMAGLSKYISVDKLTDFMAEIVCVESTHLAYLHTKYDGESGVIMKISYEKLREDKNAVFHRVTKEYDFYLNDPVMADPENKKEGYIKYNEDTGECFYHKFN